MPKIIFHHPGGRQSEVSVAAGQSLMRAAVDAGIAEIIAECGGACACGTCHCYVDAAWAAKLPVPAEGEAMMLECVTDPEARSRLSCQITLTEALDGLVIHLPAAQY